MRSPRCAAPSILALILAQGVAAAAQPDASPASPPPDHHDTPALVADPSLSLGEVIRQAAAREPGMVAVAARRSQALALRDAARRLLAGPPVLTAGYITDGVTSKNGYRQADAALELPLWWPGQRSGRRSAARAADAGAEHAASAHLLEVAGWVRTAVAELELARNRLELAEAEWKAEEALAAQVERGAELLELAQRDVLLARSSSLEQRLRYLEALEESRHNAEIWYLLTGLARWPDDWSETPREAAQLSEHPLLRLAEEDAALAEAERARLSSDQWGHPALALGTQHERELRGLDFSNRFVAGIRIPLGRGSDARRQVAAAERAAADARRDAGRLDRELRGRLAHAEHRLALTGERRSTATEQARIAAEHLRLTQRAFELGETDLGSLLRARSRATTAERTSRETRILHQLAAAQLNQALGVVP